MLSIKVLGSGCANCTKLEALVKEAIAELGVEAEVSKVQDWPQIMAYGVMATPGLVINEKVVHAGSLPDKAKVVSLITSALV
ncbi:small redox-active disulfide protein 2 [Carboxydocella sporoproducens DSM 16521]|uniref:Small redox-active disulfide protein 2 n=2 Tax=Carboxydocella TaxID=178898 RepID=A0A1T4RWD3_9FIRM|nr:small redox-active disulfide protein 2 [Carboxydocella thermautotrophica]SKA20272.1 small redox-active disulfide protein 2 [Carboxydocella sporoproducens DSM 16521]